MTAMDFWQNPTLFFGATEFCTKIGNFRSNQDERFWHKSGLFQFWEIFLFLSNLPLSFSRRFLPPSSQSPRFPPPGRFFLPCSPCCVESFLLPCAGYLPPLSHPPFWFPRPSPWMFQMYVHFPLHTQFSRSHLIVWTHHAKSAGERSSIMLAGFPKMLTPPPCQCFQNRMTL